MVVNVSLHSCTACILAMPSQSHYKPRIIDNKNGTIDIAYWPIEVGPHHLRVTYGGLPIDQNSFHFYVDEVQPERVTAYGPGLSYGCVDTDCDFTIVTNDALIGGKNIITVCTIAMNCCNGRSKKYRKWHYWGAPSQKPFNGST